MSSSSTSTDTIITLSKSLLFSLSSWLTSLSWTEWYTLITLSGITYSVYQLLKIYTGDADLQVRKALKNLPKDGFKDKIIWIIGASSGIGEYLAYEISKRQGIVILSARRVDNLRTVEKQCKQLGAKDTFILPLDVLDTFANHQNAVEQIIKKYGRIDYLVNNAGRSQRGLVERTDLTVDKEMFTLNVFGPISIMKAALPSLLKQPNGAVIVTTSSVAGKTGSPISSTYSATKHALQGFIDSARMELTYRNIRFVNICPGPVQSEITMHAFVEKPGEKLNTLQDNTKRMNTDKCAMYMAAAMYAELPEAWMAPQPILLFTYIAQYWKWLYFKVGPNAGEKRVKSFLTGETGYNSISNVWSTLSGSNSNNNNEENKRK